MLSRDIFSELENSKFLIKIWNNQYQYHNDMTNQFSNQFDDVCIVTILDQVTNKTNCKFL